MGMPLAWLGSGMEWGALGMPLRCHVGVMVVGAFGVSFGALRVIGCVLVAVMGMPWGVMGVPRGCLGGGSIGSRCLWCVIGGPWRCCAGALVASLGGHGGGVGGCEGA